MAFKIGDIVRFRSTGSTALMRIDTASLNHDGSCNTRFYGSHFDGAAYGAWEQDCLPPTEADLAMWINNVKREQVFIDCTNHRGERGLRRILPFSVRFGTSEWHKDPQWLLMAWDYGKTDFREFAMRDIHDFDASPSKTLAKVSKPGVIDHKLARDHYPNAFIPTTEQSNGGPIWTATNELRWLPYKPGEFRTLQQKWVATRTNSLDGSSVNLFDWRDVPAVEEPPKLMQRNDQ